MTSKVKSEFVDFTDLASLIRQVTGTISLRYHRLAWAYIGRVFNLADSRFFEHIRHPKRRPRPNL
ncbi:MAG: hypothetical protein U1E98_04570 [Moraxella osloensis]